MEERNQKYRITQHLQSAEVQQRILQDMQRAREEATVTISNAASLFGFTENQLRDWEKNGLLNPQRRLQDAEQDGRGAKRRQYTPSELDKLAVIRELMNAGYSPGAIPTYVDDIWTSVAGNGLRKGFPRKEGHASTEHVHIDQRVECTEKDEFWRYFVSQALRLSLLLICEDVPDTVAGIILPLEKGNVAEIVQNSDDLPKAGYSLIGWLSESRSFYTFLENEPSFQHPSDFRVEALKKLAGDYAREQAPENNILIIVQRKAKSLILSKEVVTTVQRLLGLVYETSKQWQSGFETGRRDWMYQVTDFTVSSAVSDEVLNGLANIVVQLGGKLEDGKDRWRFSCILTPEDASLPVQQRRLIVRAQSKNAPHQLAAVSAKVPGLTFRAYQSGQIIYRSNISSKDFMIAHREREEALRSAIAIPLVSNDGLAIGVIYLAANEPDAFSEDSQCILRLISRMIEELLIVYVDRRLDVDKLTSLIGSPRIVDPSFSKFLSESDFINDLEKLLSYIDTHGITNELSGEELSIIAVDIDNLAGISAKYGDLVARNLSRAVGERIVGMPGVITNSEFNQFYHVNDDRFYILLRGVSIRNARNKAEHLKENLLEPYRIDARRVFVKRAVLPDTLLILNNVTVRLGVHTYLYTKLVELLSRYPPNIAINSVSEVMASNLDKVLDVGQERGGNVIVSWDSEIRGYIVLPST